ncbi:MAG: right-handed parallel beta-helix repeat-containing protein [Candidatus Marinimicrobia bacterium]|nr:right-handed parallel beta-helix repeat-containing protein [Candidatus Neomarinimicrobiota bacterium]MBL7011071.1 right-handed parallel beta-helix repeat-containing protein [Candidatus Neomarinimicrobiota bacterium]MBL7031109.1 right-handed parallel beta-helix repeat-containing protein [Candidatus Neomarinimicrobiota bacterium]
MKNITSKLTLCLLFANFIFASDIEKDLQTQFILAEPGDTITIPEGVHQIRGTLSIEGKKNLLIRGLGMDKSILSFSGQTDGAQGISITNCKNIILENFAVQDSKGDAIKAQYVERIEFRSIKAEWTNGPKPTNGAYGIYPVQCQNVLIEFSVAIGASDAGIYVGQSSDIIVRHSTAYHNVAGIEIENSFDALVHTNNAYENTGGILIFDLPDLVQKKGGNIHVYHNIVRNNNLDNFAPPGNIVGKVLPGTGIMVLAANDVHIYENTIQNNKSIGTGIVSYFITEEAITDSLYNPYTSDIHIYNNIYSREAGLPTLDYEIGKLMAIKYGRNIPDIIYDGMQDPDVKEGLCIQNNFRAEFTNMDIEHNFEKWYSPFISNFSEDPSPHDCGRQHTAN